MFRVFGLTMGLAVFGLVSSANAQKFELTEGGLGLFDVQLISTTAGFGNTSPNAIGVWNALDLGGGPTGAVAGFTINNNVSDTETVFNYQGGGGSGFFGSNISPSTINGDGPLGGPGPFGAGDPSNYSIRAKTFIQFEAGGTYTIGMASDDARLLSLTEAQPGSAPGYSGFTGFAGETTPALNSATTVGDNTDWVNGAGEVTRATFSVGAGDILALDAFYFEGGGGDYGEISIAEGNQLAGFSTPTFQLLEDNVFGNVRIGNAIQQVPEPATLAMWSLLGLAICGAGYYRRWRN